MKKYTKVLTLLLGVGIGVGASGLLGNSGTIMPAYANNGVQYERLSGNYEEYNEGYEEYDKDYYNENCYRGGSRGCGRGSREGYRNQDFRNDNYRGSEL